MSRSRRRQQRGKCICGRHLVPFADFVQHLRHPVAECPVIGYVDVWNEQFIKYRERRSRPLTEED